MPPKLVVLSLSTGLLCGGCGQQASFLPTPQNTVVLPEGYAAAEYDLSTEDHDFGQVRVWSSGAEEVDHEDDEQTVLRIGFEVDNVSDDPLRMPAEGVRLESVTLDNAVLENVAVTRLEGPDVILPKESARIDAVFVLPEGIEPDDLDSFRLRWELRSNGTVYAEWTPFAELPYYDLYAYGPYYDPYYVGPFGPPIYDYYYPYDSRYWY